MFQPLVDVMEKFITDFSWKRIIILLGFLSLIFLAFTLYELQTATSQLSKYERTVVLLEKLSSLKQDNNSSKIIIDHIYSGLETINNPISNSINHSINLSRELKQALIASLPWILMFIAFIPGALRGDSKARNIVLGTAVFTCLIGIGGYNLPMKWGNTINFILYPILINFMLFVLLVLKGSKK
ncbi:hypothetical protein MN086_06365 [Sulfurovum sp. XGS-02]|uniref:hypothetical protein n=1 Tax=Sulfurovum sp. XGS-02 TaxID=2925411 RepID=UPI002048C772|nr:hypothetical protein [Sulfurovum sp. XGS-02]UPT76676.1 hypothetical protein MN086_06365 [Sulfurovum sp. XGS-02]